MEGGPQTFWLAGVILKCVYSDDGIWGFVFVGCVVWVFFFNFYFFKFLWRQFHSSIVLIWGVFQVRPNSLALSFEAEQQWPPLLTLWFLQRWTHRANGEFKSGAKWFGRLFPRTWVFKLLVLGPRKQYAYVVLSSSPAVSSFPDFVVGWFWGVEQEEGGSGFLSTHSTEQCKSLIIVASYGHKHWTTLVALKRLWTWINQLIMNLNPLANFWRCWFLQDFCSME